MPGEAGQSEYSWFPLWMIFVVHLKLQNDKAEATIFLSLFPESQSSWPQIGAKHPQRAEP